MVYLESIDELVNKIDQADVLATYHAIMNDADSLFTLSTQAINFIYHVQNFFPNLGQQIIPASFVTLAREQAREEPWSLGSHLYLLTHVIIGASQFYTQDITDKEKYLPLLTELEHVIGDFYEKISLDQKCEFLLCVRLLGAETWLTPMIEKELAASFSPLGNYFVDTVNINSQTKTPLKYSLFGSEHRNVLAIATFLPSHGKVSPHTIQIPI